MKSLGGRALKSLTLGGSEFRRPEPDGPVLFPSTPAEAKLSVAGSAIVVRLHRKAERPPLRMILLDIPLIPLAGFPYLSRIKNKILKLHKNQRNFFFIPANVSTRTQKGRFRSKLRRNNVDHSSDRIDDQTLTDVMRPSMHFRVDFKNWS